MISLDDAKLHLHVTDPAREPEVQLYLTQAVGAITQYLGERVATTPPELFDAGTLKLLGHYYEHRGDDAAEYHDERIWEAISLLLMRSRDPAVA